MSRLLLDTHVMLWALSAPERIPIEVRERLEDPGTTVLVSAASLWEIAIKAALGRPGFSVEIAEVASAIETAGFEALPITPQHAVAVSALPPLHRDPFDRMLIAQAIAEPLHFVTCDRNLSEYPAAFIWAG